MRQRIITAAIRRCAFAICKAAADVVSAVDRCAMRISRHLFSARHGFASPTSHSPKRLTDALRGYMGRLQPATATYQRATERRAANTAAWQVRPTQVVRVLAPVSLG